MEKQWYTRKSSLMCGTDGQNLQVKLRLADKMKQTTESEAQQQDKGVR